MNPTPENATPDALAWAADAIADLLGIPQGELGAGWASHPATRPTPDARAEFLQPAPAAPTFPDMDRFEREIFPHMNRLLAELYPAPTPGLRGHGLGEVWTCDPARPEQAWKEGFAEQLAHRVAMTEPAWMDQGAEAEGAPARRVSLLEPRAPAPAAARTLALTLGLLTATVSRNFYEPEERKRSLAIHQTLEAPHALAYSYYPYL